MSSRGISIVLAVAVGIAAFARPSRTEPARTAPAVVGKEPKIVSLEPENYSRNVDAKKVTKLVVAFDRDMEKGLSLCGGGPNYPKLEGKPRWETPKKLVVEVALEPDHEYAIGLNCPAASNFRSAEGVALTPTEWTFRTAPEKGAKSSKSATKDPPKVVSREPEHLAEDLDAKKTVKLVVTFDRPMSDDAWSFCGGGPNMPSFKNPPHWDTPKKIVVEVELEPDHQYELSLNCPAATKFRSAEGVPLVPTPWSFSTAPDDLPSPAVQKAENQKSFDALKELLANGYSYYDLRVKSWDKLYREHEKTILGARTTRAWANAVAKMLAATEDIHMHLKLGEQYFATGRRAIDPLFRSERIPDYVPVQPAGSNGLRGKTEDGIGYVMIGGWSNAKDIGPIEQALAAMQGCKAMIVDVRPNSGGDELLAQKIAAWFVDGTKVYGKNRYRTGPGKDGFGEVFDRSVTGNADAQKHLDVPVAVLTSRYVMSSNESFVLMMRQAKDCTVVGQRTYGSSGNPKAHELPNGVTLVMPSWQDLRPDGTSFEGEGLAPDVEVAATPADLEEKDPILERALEILRGKIKG